MPYIDKHTWQVGEVITQGKMNNIEDNIQALVNEVTGARTYSGQSSNTLGARIDDLVIVSDTTPTEPNNEIWLDTSNTEGSGTRTVEVPSMEDLHNLESSIADAGVYTEGNSYAVGDYVYYEESLYQCNTAIANAGEWDSSKWDNVNLSDVIHANATTIESLSEQQAFIATYGVTTTAEVYAAKTAGKQIFANKNGIYYPLVEGGQTSAGPSEYALLDGNVAKVLLLTSPSMWTSASLALAGIDNPVMDSPRAVATPTASSNNTLLATTEFVQRAVAGVMGGAVKYTEAQELTEAQKLQSRENIGAADEADVDALKSTADGLDRNKQSRPVHTSTGATVTIDVAANAPIGQFDIDLPFVQTGTGNPSMTNYRPIVGYDSITAVINGDNESIAFDNTVYVGTAKLIDGKAVSKYQYIEFDGTENWAANTGNTHYVLRYNVPAASTIGGNNKQHCTHFLCGYGDQLNLMATPYGTIDIQAPTTNNTFPSLSDWTTYLAQQYANDTPVAICYELATPTEVDCTALEIATVSGENTFSCSAGNSTVTYLGDLIEITDGLESGKLDKNQNSAYAGRALVIGLDGVIEPSGTPFGADPGVNADYAGTLFEINSYGEQTVEATAESTGESIDIWRHDGNILPPISAGSIGNVAITVEADGTLVFNGTVSAAGVHSATMNNVPCIFHGNEPFDGYIFSYVMNKAAPNETGYVIVQVLNQSNNNFISMGFKSSTALTGTLTNSYGSSTTSLKTCQIQFYNIPNGTVFSDWRLKCKLEHHPVATAYTKPSLSHKTVSITDGSGSTTLNLVNGTNHVITNADNMTFAAKTVLRTPSYVSKRWACFGDSITQKDQSAYQNNSLRYYDIVSQELGLTCINYGRATTGYSTTGNVLNGQYYVRMQSINPNDFDFMTIMGSTNDIAGMSSGTIQLGNYDDTGTATVCGCINTTLDYYYALAPLKPIGMISMLPTYAYGPDLIKSTIAENYVNVQKQICANRGIPFLDLYHGSGMRPWNDTVKAALFGDGDGIHPNNEGIKWFAPMIREFVKTLV